MTDFQIGDRVVHTYRDNLITYGIFLGESEWGSCYVVPENTNVFGRPDHKFQGKLCYALTRKYLKLAGPPPSPKEKVIAKIKALDARFKNKTLRKTTMKPLALPR